MTENELKVMRNAVATIFERVGRHDLCNAAHVFCEGVACSECPFGCDENLSAIVEDLKGGHQMTDTKEILYAKWRATAREFGQETMNGAQIIGDTDGFDNLSDGMFVHAPTASIHTLSNVPHNVARFFEDAELDAETKGESK